MYNNDKDIETSVLCHKAKKERVILAKIDTSVRPFSGKDEWGYIFGDMAGQESAIASTTSIAPACVPF